MAIKADLIKFTRDELGITHEQATKYVEAEINLELLKLSKERVKDTTV